MGAAVPSDKKPRFLGFLLNFILLYVHMSNYENNLNKEKSAATPYRIRSCDTFYYSISTFRPFVPGAEPAVLP